MLTMNEQFVEKRAASTIGSTADVLPGTLMNVPSALPTGPVPNAPVVAVNVISKWKSKIVWLSAVALPALTWLYTWLTSAGVLAFKHHPAFFATGVTLLGLFIGYLRTDSNTVVGP
jgi:hypothetical protein